MAGLIVILLYAFKLAFLASLACIRTKEFSLKSEVKKAYLHAHKRILIMPAIMKEVYGSNHGLFTCTIEATIHMNSVTKGSTAEYTAVCFGFASLHSVIGWQTRLTLSTNGKQTQSQS